MTLSADATESHISETVTLNITLTIPIFNSVLTDVTLSLGILGFIESFKVIKAGRNVNGFMTDINNGVEFLTASSHAGNSTLNFGVVTNTGKFEKTSFIYKYKL